MEKLLIGKIIKPQGLSGEVKCQMFVDFDAITNLSEVYLKDKDVPTRVLKSSYRLGYLYLTLSKIDDRNKADFLRNAEIYIDKANYAETKQDVYLIDDLQDCRIISENGEDYGRIVRVENYGATDIIIVFADQREYMVPFVKDIFKKVNLKAKLVIVDEQKYLANRFCE